MNPNPQVSVQALFPEVSEVPNTNNMTNEKRVWRRITEQERFKLEAAVDFGLPVDFAGKIIKMSRRNANRIMSEHWANQRAESDTIRFMSED